MKMPRLASSTPWAAVLASLLMFSLLCGLLVYWGLALAAPAVSIAPAGSLVSRSTGLDTGMASTMFGRADGSAPVASAPLPRNIKVVGIAASADRSAVIVSVDGQSAAAFGVGQQIDDSLKVVSVDRLEVVLEHRGETIRVPAPASGDLSALNSNDGADTTAQSAPPLREPEPRPSRNAQAPRRLASTSPATSARPPLPPRTLPPAGAAAAQPQRQSPPRQIPSPPPQQAATNQQPNQRPNQQPIASSQDPNRPPTALGRALQQMERPSPVVR